MPRKKDSKEISEEFPYDEFPWKLTYKDGKEKRTCYFQCENHLKKHLERSKLKKKDYILSYKYAE